MTQISGKEQANRQRLTDRWLTGRTQHLGDSWWAGDVNSCSMSGSDSWREQLLYERVWLMTWTAALRAGLTHDVNSCSMSGSDSWREQLLYERVWLMTWTAALWAGLTHDVNSCSMSGSDSWREQLLYERVWLMTWTAALWAGLTHDVNSCSMSGSDSCIVTLSEQGQCTKETLTLFRARRDALYQVLANCYFPPVVPGQVRTINTTKLNKTQII